MEEPIIGVYHLACMNHYLDIFSEQFDLLHDSGLYDASQKILIFISMDDSSPALNERLKKYDPQNKFIINRSRSNLKEKFAINNFQKYIKNEDAHIYYFHGKGVSKTELINPVKYNYVKNWRHILNYYTLEKWRLNLEFLKKYDAVGCFLKRWPAVHFSGNFWWARYSYIKNLPKRCGERYLDSEMWIGRNHKNNFICLTSKARGDFNYHKKRSDKDIIDNAVTDLQQNKNCGRMVYTEVLE